MANLPVAIRTALGALRLREARPEALRSLNDAQWLQLLAFTDRMHLTLPFGDLCHDYLPEWVQTRIHRNLSDNTRRFDHIRAMYLEIADAFRNDGIEHVLLKGFAQAVAGATDPRLRFQSDLDLFCPEESLPAAHRVLENLGYSPLRWGEVFPSDQHDTPMVRASNWEWAGNHFDPEMPVSVEVHGRFWNEGTTHFGPEGLEQFWPRRTTVRLEDFEFPALHPIDNLGYSCLHAVRHMLYGLLLTNHIYEIAGFLEKNADDAAFWKLWYESHSESLRGLEAICFSVAHLWFDCRLSEHARAEIDRLPRPIQQWLRKHGTSPVYTAFRPNKDALWLHLSLIKSPRVRRQFLLHSLILRRVPLQGIADKRTRELMLWRAAFHSRVLFPTIWKGIQWWWSSRNLRSEF